MDDVEAASSDPASCFTAVVSDLTLRSDYTMNTIYVHMSIQLLLTCEPWSFRIRRYQLDFLTRQQLPCSASTRDRVQSVRKKTRQDGLLFFQEQAL